MKPRSIAVTPMPRYEFKEGTSSKFWQIDLDGTAFTTTYGKIGTSGQTSLKQWKDAATAKKEYDKLIAEKTKKGYSLVGGGGGGKTSTNGAGKKTNGAAAAAAPAPAKKATKVAAAPAAKKPAAAKGNAALEKKIDAEPDNDDAWAVYTDWLVEQGDPRGELGAVQERLRTDPKNKELLSAEKKLFKDHGDALFGSLVKMMCKPGTKAIPSITTREQLGPDARSDDGSAPPLRPRWRAGFITHAFVGYPGYDWEGDDVDIPKLLEELMTSPTGRFLTSLNIGMANTMDDGENDYTDIIKRLLKLDGTSRLRRLYIGDVTQEECEVSWIEIGDVSKLWPKLSKLQSLTLRGGSGVKLGSIALPELRELTIITGGLDKKNLAAICNAKWPKLEKLDLWFGSKSYGANTTLKDLKPIFDGKVFPKVKHLGLNNCEFTDEIAQQLPTAKILKQLQVLDLSDGCMTDAGVKAMADAKGAFQHLARLDLSNNYLSPGERLSSTLNKQTRSKPQRKPSEYDGVQHRYVSLGE